MIEKIIWRIVSCINIRYDSGHLEHLCNGIQTFVDMIRTMKNFEFEHVQTFFFDKSSNLSEYMNKYFLDEQRC